MIQLVCSRHDSKPEGTTVTAWPNSVAAQGTGRSGTKGARGAAVAAVCAAAAVHDRTARRIRHPPVFNDPVKSQVQRLRLRLACCRCVPDWNNWTGRTGTPG